MAVISPPILKLLSDLDIDLMDVDSDMDYLRALMEATNSLTISNPSDRRIPILQKEVKRVRDNRRAKSQIVKKKVSTSKLLNRKDVGEKGKESNTGKLSRILRDTRGRVLSNEKKIDNFGSVENQGEGADKESFNPIIDGLNSIIETLRGDRKFNKKKTEKQRKEKENKKRASKEKLLEGAKGVWKGITKIAGTILSPFQKLWSDILGFLSAIFVGRVLYKLVDWVGNPENQGKIKSIFRFLKDWWPVLLGAYVVFGTGLVGFATGFISTVVGFAATLAGTVIPALITAATAMGPWGIAALALLGTAAIISTKKNKTDQKVDQSVKEVGAEETSNIIKDQQENRSPLQKAGDFLTGADQERKEQIQKLDTGTEKRYGFFGEIKPKKMNKGGTVPGSGNTDTVPAMLTPGEFVMSKGAVQKYGADTLANMNAAGGGTNRPTIMGGYKEGGKAADRSHFGTEGYRMGQVLPDQFMYNKETFTSSLKTKGGEVIEDKETLTELGGSIGMPDLIENQTQLVESIRKVKGYEDINFMDVVQYPDGRGKLVGMPEEKLYPIFNASDAWKASDARRDEAIRIDQESGTQFLDPRETSKIVGLKGGGLVTVKPGTINSYKDAIDAGIKVEDIVTGTGRFGKIMWKEKQPRGLFGLGKQKYIIKSKNWNLSGVGGAIDKEMAMSTEDYVNMKMGWSKATPTKSATPVKSNISGSGILGPISSDPSKMVNMNAMKVASGKDKDLDISPSSKKSKVTVAYQDQLNKSTSSSPPAGGNKKIPNFSATSMRSADKIRVLGISV